MKTIIIGAGGHALSILAIENIIPIEIVGYSAPESNDLMPIPYLGNDDDILNKYPSTDYQLIIGVSYMGKRVDLSLRQNIISKFKGYKFGNIVAKSSIVKTEKIGEGTIVFEGSIINVGVEIGTNCVINTSALIEHHCVIGNNTQISPKATILGGATIGENSFIGACAVIRDSITISNNTIVRMGAVVVKDITNE